MPNLLEDAYNHREGLATGSAVLKRNLFILQASWRHANVVEEYSQRTMGLVANHSWIFSEFLDVFTPQAAFPREP
jgi:hypothetical protein